MAGLRWRACGGGSGVAGQPAAVDEEAQASGYRGAAEAEQREVLQAGRPAAAG